MRMRWLALPVLIVLWPISAAGLEAWGHVVDQDGKPVPNARVYAMENDSLNAETTTDAEGKFAFTSLSLPDVSRPKWRYVLIASKPGKWWGWIHGIGSLMLPSYKTSDPPDGYTISVAGFRTFEGEAVDDDGKPLSGAVAKPEIIFHKERQDRGG